MACFTAIKNNEPWLKHEWIKAGGAELSRERAEEIIKILDRPISELINELSHEIENDPYPAHKFEQAEKEFLEALRAEKLRIRGIKKVGNRNSEFIPTDFLLRDDIAFTHPDNKLSVWGSSVDEWNTLKVKTTDVLNVWHEQSQINDTISDETKPEPKSLYQCPDHDNIFEFKLGRKFNGNLHIFAVRLKEDDKAIPVRKVQKILNASDTEMKYWFRYDHRLTALDSAHLSNDETHYKVKNIGDNIQGYYCSHEEVKAKTATLPRLMSYQEVMTQWRKYGNADATLNGILAAAIDQMKCHAIDQNGKVQPPPQNPPYGDIFFECKRIDAVEEEYFGGVGDTSGADSVKFDGGITEVDREYDDNVKAMLNDENTATITEQQGNDYITPWENKHQRKKELSRRNEDVRLVIA